eukprot:464151_1
MNGDRFQCKDQWNGWNLAKRSMDLRRLTANGSDGWQNKWIGSSHSIETKAKEEGPRPRTTKEESGTIREWNQDKDHQKHGGRTRTKSKEEDKGTKGLNCIYVCNVCVSVFVF